MRRALTLTTTEASGLAEVAPSTLKRWADQGLLPFTRTAGGHRRFERWAVERLVREQLQPAANDEPLAGAWVRCLVDGQRHALDSRLLEARARLGAWSAVCDELGGALAELGHQWRAGRLTIADEHSATEGLLRALARFGDAMPRRPDGPRVLLACVGEDDHTLGLAMAELCLLELGWTPRWHGRRTPVGELVRLVRAGGVGLVALSASAASRDAAALKNVADEVGAACRSQRAGLLLGGQGHWPTPPSYGARLTAFSSLEANLTSEPLP